GKPHGLFNYWEGTVINPGLNTVIPYTATTPTPLHSRTPTPLEYEGREDVALSSLTINMDKLRTCKYVEGTKVHGAEGGHIELMRNLLKDANDAGATITDEQFHRILLDSFPASQNWYPKTTLQGVIAGLIANAEILDKYKPQAVSATDPTVKALIAQVAALTASLNLVQSARSGNSSRAPPKHPEWTCTNPNCKLVGHLIADCFKLGGGKQGQYPDWWKGKRDVPLPSANLAIAGIERVALSAYIEESNIFLAYDLPQTAEPEMERIIIESPSLLVEKIIHDNTIPIEQHISLVASTQTIPGGEAAIYADSGASVPFFQKKDMFQNYTIIPNGSTGTSSNRHAALQIIGTGDVEILVHHKGIPKLIAFKNAVHCPDIASNLVSISRCTKGGLKALFDDVGVTFLTKDMMREVFGGQEINGLY
ncbi:hypothetical protein C8J56DRAFT_757813, partial [Mycena floridula]